MCGIAGAFGGISDAQAASLGKDIIRTIRYRGPDGDGFQQFDNGFFVHLRLAIIDLSAGGAQPKWSADGRYCITYNGEIYNYRELRAELVQIGYVFNSDSDTEVLLNVWDAWGPDGLKRCIGMYALALFDTREQKLHFARDPYGIKPLYVTRTAGGIRFASTYTALACFADCPRSANPRRAFEFLRHGMLELRGDTLVSDVRSIEPGMVETWDVRRGHIALLDSQVRIRPGDRRVDARETFAQAAERLRDAFMRSVRLHMRSDVPIGFGLSGGINSSAIVCAARILEPDADLKTFTFVGEGAAADESCWAHIISEHTKATPHAIRLRGADAVGSLETMIQAYGTPTSSMSPMAQVGVFEAARQAGVTVMLNGQGADELFGGYLFYVGSALAGYLKRGQIADAVRLLRAGSRLPRSNARNLCGYALEHLLPLKAQRAARRLAGYEFMPDWVNQDWLSSRTGMSTLEFGHRLDGFGSDVLGERLAFDLTELVIPNLLAHEDRNSMWYSIESRVPFLSSPMSDVAFSVPSSFLLGPDAVSKRLLREALRGIVPEKVRLRGDKIGFEAPQGDWLFGEHAQLERLLSSDEARSIKILDHKKLMERWRRIDGPTHPDFQYVWRWFGLILWTRAFQITWA